MASAQEIHVASCKTNLRRQRDRSQSCKIRKQTLSPDTMLAQVQICRVNKVKDKQTGVNFFNLRNDLDLGHHLVCSWLDKKKPTSDEVVAFGKDIVNKLLMRKILTKEQILFEINVETATLPKRSCSAGGHSPGTPRSSEKKSKSQSRSRRDKFDDVKTHLTYDEDKALPAGKRGVKEDLFIENSELRSEINRLMEQLKSNQDRVSVGEFNDLLKSFTQLQLENEAMKSELTKEKNEKVMWANHIDVLANEINRLNREADHDSPDRYRPEQNEPSEKYKKLVEDFKRMKEKYERKITCKQYEKQKSEERIQNLQADADYLKKRLKESEETVREKTENLQTMTEAAESYERTNDNQQKYILELQDSNGKPTDDVIKDAKEAIVYYKAETEKYRKFSNQAKSENLKMKMEKEELLTKLQKLRADAKDKSHELESKLVTLKTRIQTLETEKEEMDKNNEKQTTELKLVKNLLSIAKKNLDQQDMKRYEKDCMKQKHEKEALEDQLMKMENQYATQTEEHIESEQKLKHEMNRYRNERNRLQKKVELLTTEVSDLTSKFEEQQILFTLEKEKLESDIDRLEKHLNDVEHVQIQDFNTRASDYQKEEMDRKNEELVRLTQKLYHVEEDLKSYKEQVVVLETKDNAQMEVIRRLSQQLKSSEDRTNAAKRLSDIEKENASLKRELTEAVQSLERNKDCKDRYDRDCNKLRKEIERLKKMEKEKDDLQIDNNRLNDQINQLQVHWDRLKSDREQEKAIAEEVMKLKEQKFRLENDKHLLRQEVLSLQEKVKSADEFRHSNEVLRSEVESLKASIRGLQTENRLLEDKCKSETTARITRDDLSSRYKEDCERLRKERNTAQQDLVKISREKEELVNRLRTEFESLKLEVDKTKNEKAELGVLYKAQLKKEEEKIKRLEKQNEILQERTSSTETSDQHQAYELLQLKNDYEICKVQKKQLEEENRELKQEVADLENKQESTRDRQCEECPVLQREIESLKKRLSEQVERNSNEDILSRKVQVLKADNRILEQKLAEMEKRKCKLCDELSQKLLKAETELKDAERRCKLKEEGLAKINAEVRQVKIQNRQLESNMVTLRQDKKTLVSNLEMMMERVNKFELQRIQRSLRERQCEQCPVLQREIERLKKRLDEQNERDSPNGEDSNTSTLCDPERPSRLCERFRDIFHGSWYDAYEHLNKTDDELTVIKYLLEVVRNSYEFGEGVFNQYLKALNEALVGQCHNKKISSEIQVMNFNYAKRVAKLVKGDIVQLYMSKPEYKSAHPVIQTFVAEVVAICWRFLAHDPPLKLLIDPDTRLFNAELFDEYKHKGRSISYVVWPMMYREENDKMIVMGKGIAEAN